MRFGAASDVHMRVRTPIFPHYRGSEDNCAYFEKALRWFDRLKVDAVVVAGDVADRGLIAEWEQFADTWNRVFPKCKAADGRRVERIVVTGNHDIGQWPALWQKISDADQKKHRFDHPDNLRRLWRSLMDEEWELVSMRKVKGIPFVASQYMSLKPPVEAFFRENADIFDPELPTFFVQHAHPAGTCFSGSKFGFWDYDMNGQTVRALSRLPKSVALSGHSHNSVVDGRSVWQGAFTSINCGCTWGAGLVYHGRDNALAPFFGEYKKQRMDSLVPLENAGRCCLAFDVYADHLTVHRWCVQTDEPLGEDWVIPLPAQKGGPFDFGRVASKRKAAKSVPQFAKGAKVTVEQCPKPPKNVGPVLKGREVLRVVFPMAETVRGVRVLDYEVKVLRDGVEVACSTVLAPGFFLPERLSRIDGEALFAVDELPASTDLRISVTPRDCYGVEGVPILGDTFRVRGERGILV
jgi:predicted phosphodiesterase